MLADSSQCFNNGRGPTSLPSEEKAGKALLPVSFFVSLSTSALPQSSDPEDPSALQNTTSPQPCISDTCSNFACHQEHVQKSTVGHAAVREHLQSITDDSRHSPGCRALRKEVMPVRRRMCTVLSSVAKVGPDAVATTLCLSYTDALVPKAGPCRHSPQQSVYQWTSLSHGPYLMHDNCLPALQITFVSKG